MTVAAEEVILTSDPKFAQHVFEKNGKNYVQRMANNDGLSKLGMLNTGLIWNNDDTWTIHCAEYSSKKKGNTFFFNPW
eukprot:4525260-Amphidinium_carterae.1